MAFWLAAAVTCAFYICKAVADPDLWWHITVGQWIAANWDVPVTDHWNMFARGEEWRAYSWLPELVFSAVNSTFGAHGLLALQLVFGALFSLSLFYCLSQISKDWFFGALCGAYAALSCFNHFALRPQLLVWVYLVWSVYLAWRVEKDGLLFKHLLPLCLVIVLWANTHITTALGIGSVFLWLCAEGKMKVAIKAALLCFAATFITPYGGREWLIFFSKTGHPFSHQGIMEFAPATIDQTAVGMLLIGVSVLLLMFHLRPASIIPARLFAWIMFLLGGLAVVKFLPFAIIWTALLIAHMWGAQENPRAAFANFGEALFRLNAGMGKAVSLAGALTLAAFCAGKGVLLWREPLNEDRLAVKAFNFVESSNLPTPVLVPFDFGGYQMYRLSDGKGVLKYPVSIDGRTNLVPAEIWEEFMAAFRGRPNWRHYISRVNPSTVVWRSGSAFVSLLLVAGQWCLVHRSGKGDDEAVVLLKKELFYGLQTEFPLGAVPQAPLGAVPQATLLSENCPGASPS